MAPQLNPYIVSNERAAHCLTYIQNSKSGECPAAIGLGNLITEAHAHIVLSKGKLFRIIRLFINPNYCFLQLSFILITDLTLT